MEAIRKLGRKAARTPRVKVNVALKTQLLLSLPFRFAGTVNVGLASKALGKTPLFQEARGSSGRFLLILLGFVN